MALIPQNSRISHHTLTTSGATFSVPSSEDFTDGSWTAKDLCQSEIGVNETDKRVFMRVGSDIIEFNTSGSTSSQQSLGETLIIGNTTSGTDIIMSTGDVIRGISYSDNRLDLEYEAILKTISGNATTSSSCLIGNNIILKTSTSRDFYTGEYGWSPNGYNNIYINTAPESHNIGDAGYASGSVIIDTSELILSSPSKNTQSMGVRYYQDELQYYQGDILSRICGTNSSYAIRSGNYNDYLYYVKANVISSSDSGDYYTNEMTLSFIEDINGTPSILTIIGSSSNVSLYSVNGFTPSCYFEIINGDSIVLRVVPYNSTGWFCDWSIRGTFPIV